MKITRLISGVVVGVLALASTWPANAFAVITPDLVVAQLKVTSSSGQFITLYNQTNSALNLSKYELDYISSSGKLSGLAVSGNLAANSYYVLADDQLQACYQEIFASTSLGMTVGTGSELQVWKIADDGLSKSLQDDVRWTSTSSAMGSNDDPWLLPTNHAHFLARLPIDANNNPQVSAAGGGTWTEADFSAANPCIEEQTSTSLPVSPSSVQLLPSTPPPAKILTLASTSTAGIPASDDGLKAPAVNELLPNPSSADKGEFIELYNPNSASFDLQNFVLQTGTTTLHKYTFPSGVSLRPASFTAFLTAGTNLSLANNSGQVELLDPSGKVVSKSDIYSSAKSGQAWALGNGVWYWTTTPTPSAENTINQVSSTSTTGSGPQVLGASTTGSNGSASAGIPASATTASPIHPWTLAAVGALAIGYALYEYRHDLANRLDQFRRYRAARAAAGAKLAGRRGAGASRGLGRGQNNLRARTSRRIRQLRDRF